MGDAEVIALLLFAGFGAGSIPFGVLLARRRGVDIRKAGSGNIGATNVTRVLGLGTGLVVLALDAGKGAFATWLAHSTCGIAWVVAATGFAAILGHCFSPWLGGKGGKGVATALGAFVVISPVLAAIAVGVFAIVAGLSRVPALGSLAGIAVAASYAIVTGAPPAVSTLAVATLVLLVITHRGNLARLLTTSR